MSNIWVLVAESSRAKVFRADSRTGPLQEVADWVHPSSRLHERDISSDLPGSNSAADGNRHNYDSRSTIKDHELTTFAKEIDSKLENAHNQGEFDELVVAAATPFIGSLRKNMSDNISKVVIHEINKNLVKMNAKEIRDHLPKYL